MNPTGQIDTMYSPTSIEDFISTIEYRVVRSKEELQKAFTLVYNEYLKRGYVKKDPSCLRLSAHNAIPETTTFVAIADKEVFATATLVSDSPLGLPMDEIYGQELNQLRQRQTKLCEITMLASNTDIFRNGVSMMLNSRKLFFIFSLFKLIYDYARYINKLDYICITINPKHKLTYNFLLFKELGELKTYDKVNGAPAVAEYLDIAASEEECRKMNKEGLYKMFFAKKTSFENFSGKFVFTPQDLKYFFIENTDIFKTIPADKMAYIKSCYPTYDFSGIIK